MFSSCGKKLSLKNKAMSFNYIPKKLCSLPKLIFKYDRTLKFEEIILQRPFFKIYNIYSTVYFNMRFLYFKWVTILTIRVALSGLYQDKLGWLFETAPKETKACIMLSNPPWT